MSAGNSPPDFSTPRGIPFRVGKFLRLIERDGLISLTNLAVWVSLFKLATVKGATVTDLGTLLVAMLAYGYRAHRRSKEVAATSDAAQPLADLAATVARWEGKLDALAGTVRLGSRGR